MNTITKSIAAVALAAAGIAAIAQDSTRPTPREGGPSRPRLGHPVIAALDANHDGVIDATEIANSVKALLALDKNGDGQLSKEEIQPAGPAGGRGPGGRGGPGGPGGEGRPRRSAPAE